MEKQELRQRILNIIGDVIGWNNLKESDVLVLDRYYHYELIVAFQSDFNVNLWELDWNKINTVGELVSVVVERINILK